MLFKNDVPTSHRVWFVLATTYTARAFLEFRRGVPADFAFPVCFWLINAYLWLLRRKWRLAGDGVEAHYSFFDRAFQPFERKFSQASVTIKGLYWGCIVLAAIAIYLAYSR